MEEIARLLTHKGQAMTQAEVGGSDSKETRFIPETTDIIYVTQVDSGRCSPSCSVNSLSIALFPFPVCVYRRVD